MPARHRIVLSLLILITVLLSVPVPGYSAGTLEVLCAPAMRPPIEELLSKFNKEKGIKTQVSFDGSNIILGQLRLRSHGDIYVPADKYYIDTAVKTRLVQEPVTYTYLVPVIMVQKNNPLKIRKVADLKNPKIRIGLVDERTGAIGNVSNAIFKKNKIDVKKLNIVYRATMVDELANAIRLKSIDAVIVWKPVAMLYNKYGDIVSIPNDKNVIIKVSAGIIKSSKNKAAAREFLKYLTSKTGQTVLIKHNYPVLNGKKAKN